MSEAVFVYNATKQFGGMTEKTQYALRISRGKYTYPLEMTPVQVALDHITFTVEPGEIFGVLGPSGAGKSTLIRLLATLLLPDGGDIRIFDYDVVRQPVQVRQLINPVSSEATFLRKLSPYENLVLQARKSGLGGVSARRQVMELLRLLGLPEEAHAPPMELMPRGMQQRASLAHALLNSPRLLLLDDPARGLNPVEKLEFQAVLRQMRDLLGTTVLITTRDPLEAESLCDRIALFDNGSILAVGTPAGLKGSLGTGASLSDAFASLAGRSLP